MFVAEGDLVVHRALDASHIPVALLCDESHADELSALVNDDVPVYVGSDALRRDVTGLGVPLSMVGLFQRPAMIDADELVARSTHVVVLESIDNPTNVGAIARSALALGWNAVLLDSTSADPLARRALRVSMGAGLSIPFARVQTRRSLVDVLSMSLHSLYALTPGDGATDISDVRMKSEHVAVALGAERTGLSDEVLGIATACVRIPMHAGTDSLNVGAAAAIALHALGPNGRHSGERQH